jgi:hypothetical protein
LVFTIPPNQLRHRRFGETFSVRCLRVTDDFRQSGVASDRRNLVRAAASYLCEPARTALKKGDIGIRKIATTLGVGTDTVQRIRAGMVAAG